MNTRLMRNRVYLFIAILIVFISSQVVFAGDETFRGLLNNALKFYIERDYSSVLKELEKATLMMRNLAPLKKEAFLFCESIDMFAKYTPREDKRFRPGEEFLIYFQPGNYSLLKIKEGWEINLREYFEIYDDKGRLIKKMKSPLDFHTVLLFPLTTGLYFKNSDEVPEKEGKYVLKVVLEDFIKDKKLEAELPFEVVSSGK